MSTAALKKQILEHNPKGNYISSDSPSGKFFSQENTDNRIKPLNQSWDFTPLPEFLKIHEKHNIINTINKLNFSKNPKLEKANNLYLRQPYKYRVLMGNEVEYEVPGDITKYRPPAYSFGASREENKPVSPENIKPCPGTYNIPPSIGILKNFQAVLRPPVKIKNNYSKYLVPGNGSNLSFTNNGNFNTNNFSSSKKNLRDNNGETSKMSLFSGTGRYTLGGKWGGSSKSIGPTGRNYALLKVNGGPGMYNHYSQFLGDRYSQK